MATAAKLGIGSKLKYDSGGGTYVAIAEVLEIGGPKMESKEVDVTNLDSPSSTREYIGGLSDGGSLDFSLNYTKASAALILPFLGVTKNWRIEVPETSTPSQFNFSGPLKMFEPEVGPDKAVVLKCSVKVTGTVSFVQGS